MSDNVTVPVDPEVITLLDKLQEKLNESPAAKEFGLTVTREIAARVALLRGIEALDLQEETMPSAVETKKAEPVQPKATEPAKPVDTSVNLEYNDKGEIKPPAGWELWRAQIPSVQENAHDYYTQRGWRRWHGKVQDRLIAFYWSQDVEKHAVDAFDPNIIVQTTPWGPGHIIPDNWNPA